MAEESFEEKTEKATPRKRKEAREKGEVVKSRELPSVAVLLSGLVTLSLLCSYTYRQIDGMMHMTLSFLTTKEMGVNAFMSFGQQVFISFALILFPLLAAVFISAILANIAQVGFTLSAEPIKPKLSTLNPFKGLKRLLSRQSLMELCKSLLKLVIIGWVAYVTVKGEMYSIQMLWDMELYDILSHILYGIYKVSIRCALAMLLLVVMDYGYQKWEFEKRMRMSRKEIQDEHKRSEGDPLIKSRIKQIQRQMARKRMMQAVPKADVVITNPTHFAVALKYDSPSMRAPRVTAKGMGDIAEKIKEIAKRHHVPIVENKELAQGLYAMVEIEQEIPFDFYHAVAEVLAYIYRLKNHGAPSGGTRPQ